MHRLKDDIKKRSFHKCYLLYGEEDYLKRLYRDSLKEAVLNGGDEMNYSYFEGKDIDISEIKAISETLPFFSDFRIVVVEGSGLFKSANELSDYLPNMPDTTVLVFVENEADKRNKLYKFVNKNGLVVELTAMSEKDTKKWIAGYLKKADKKMRESTASYLLSQVDNSLDALGNELEKLIAYTAGRSEITKEDINTICSAQVTGHIFQMTDAVALGDKSLALSLYKDLLLIRESPMAILYLLTRHFTILLQMKTAGNRYTKGELAKKVGVPPFAVGKYQAQVDKFTEKRLREMLEKCADTEYRFKRGTLDAQIGVEILIVGFVSE